jgi:hypothetical protein
MPCPVCGGDEARCDFDWRTSFCTETLRVVQAAAAPHSSEQKLTCHTAAPLRCCEHGVAGCGDPVFHPFEMKNGSMVQQVTMLLCKACVDKRMFQAAASLLSQFAANNPPTKG